VNFDRLRSLVTSNISNFTNDVSENVECFEESFKSLVNSSLAINPQFTDLVRTCINNLKKQMRNTEAGWT